MTFYRVYFTRIQTAIAQLFADVTTTTYTRRIFSVWKAMQLSQNRIQPVYGRPELLDRSRRALHIVVLVGAATLAACGRAAPSACDSISAASSTVQEGTVKKLVQPYVQATDAEDASRIFGRWQAQTTVGEALLGTVEISPQQIHWHGKTTPRCTSQYSIETISRGSFYPDQVAHPRMHTPGRIYVTYRLKIEDPICARVAASLQISTMSDIDEAAVVILYDQHNHKDAEFTISR